MHGLIPEPYAPFAERVFAAFAEQNAVTTEADVAAVVFRCRNRRIRATPLSRPVPTPSRWFRRDERRYQLRRPLKPAGRTLASMLTLACGAHESPDADLPKSRLRHICTARGCNAGRAARWPGDRHRDRGSAGSAPANLTRHIRRLEKAGLVSLVEKRDTGRNLEKWYATTALTFDVAPDVDTLKSPHKTALAFARSDLSAALARLPDDATGAVQVLVAEAKLTGGQVRVFAAELSRLAERFKAQANANAEGQSAAPRARALPRRRRRLAATGGQTDQTEGEPKKDDERRLMHRCCFELNRRRAPRGTRGESATSRVRDRGR